MKSQKIFTEYPEKTKMTLNMLCMSLLEEQKKDWPRIAEAYSELAKVRVKTISCGNYSVNLQFNPQRAVSSGAAVDAESIKNRPCFLCTKNLPPQQQGIVYQNEYMILCNPAPIFDPHFTLVHLHHQPQEIVISINRLLDLTKDLSPSFAVFYNGPACGASAPDHLHFQAIPANALPLLSASNNLSLVKDISGVKIYRAEKLDRSIIILEAKSRDAIREQFARLIKIMQKIIATSDEPMINVICTFENGFYRLIIFPRQKHRPAAFYEEGAKRIFVSLGAVDMAGVIITPMLADFNRLEAEDIRGIYREVSLGENVVDKIMEEQ